jgi:hypothetical protein
MKQMVRGHAFCSRAKIQPSSPFLAVDPPVPHLNPSVEHIDSTSTLVPELQVGCEKAHVLDLPDPPRGHLLQQPRVHIHLHCEWPGCLRRIAKQHVRREAEAASVPRPRRQRPSLSHGSHSRTASSSRCERRPHCSGHAACPCCCRTAVHRRKRDLMLLHACAQVLRCKFWLERYGCLEPARERDNVHSLHHGRLLAWTCNALRRPTRAGVHFLCRASRVCECCWRVAEVCPAQGCEEGGGAGTIWPWVRLAVRAHCGIRCVRRCSHTWRAAGCAHPFRRILAAVFDSFRAKARVLISVGCCLRGLLAVVDHCGI